MGNKDEYDEDQDAIDTAADLGKAAREGDHDAADKLADKIKRKGWLK